MEDRRPSFSYLFLLRVPLVILLIVVFFRPLAFGPSLGAYLEGMYEATQLAMMMTAAVAVPLWLALTTITNTVLRTAHLRFMLQRPAAFLERPLFENLSWLRKIGLTEIWAGVALAASVYAAGILWLLSGYVELQGATAWLPVLGGLIAGAAICSAGGCLVMLVEGQLSKGRPGYVALFMRWAGTPEGYFHNGLPVPGHKFASNAMLISLVLYGAGGMYGWYNGFRLPTLMCVLLLLTNACWLLSALSYLLDRWRIPVFLVLGLYGVASAYWSTDHLFPIEECKANCSPAVSAGDIAGEGQQPVVLVATSGGGILAAAWTGAVLGQLSRQTEFVPALKLISGVSGGSTGAMHFVHLLRSNALTPERAFGEAARSSLDAVAWGLTYPDFFRTLPTAVFFQPKIDRAVALRQAWTEHDPALRDARLSQWTPGKGTPAVIFNSTVAETGERFMFANYKVAPLKQDVEGRRVFFETFDHHDIPVSAAVANSAAFPYVSPAARADVDEKKTTKLFHLVDGGYYDNFGVASALDFVSDALPRLAGRPVVLVLIEASPDYAYTSATFQSEGWFYQALAPPKGFIRMWNTAARARNSADLEWAKQLLPQLQVVHFVYSDEKEYPTSWHLTAGQQAKIQRQWSTPKNRANAECVGAILERRPEKEACDPAKLRGH